MTKKAPNAALVGILLLLCAPLTFGCICELVPPPFYNYSQYETVFVGTVKSVKTDEDNFPEKVEINVEQDFKGMNRKTAFTNNYRDSCSWDFKKDDKFLFYGNLDEKKPDNFGTGYCTRTAPFSENLLDFDFLRKIANEGPVYWVWGSIFSGWYDNPLAGINAQVYDDKKKLVGASDENGNIKVPVSGEGHYKVRVFVPKGTSLTANFGGNMGDLKRWQSTFRGAKLRRAKPYVEFDVEVKPNKCGWFHLKIGKQEND